MKNRRINSLRDLRNKKCIVYHYCPCWAFENIIRTREFWFSSKTNSNDEIEFQIPELILKELKDMSDFSSKIEMIDSCISYLQQKTKEIFMLSFSLDGDKLSQWRSYADDGRGFAIGIETELTYVNSFRETPKVQQNSPYIFMKVLYHNVSDLKKELVHRMLKMEWEDIDQFKRDLIYYAAGSKYCKFYEEEEVRLVCFSPKETQTRLSPQGPMEYISLPIPVEQKLYITIGPKNACTQEEIKKFLEIHGFKDTLVLPAIQHYK